MPQLTGLNRCGVPGRPAPSSAPAAWRIYVDLRNLKNNIVQQSRVVPSNDDDGWQLFSSWLATHPSHTHYGL